ncbi:hypothetical protein L1987_36200 [Smallanthus sonchifolius]|uniref:Uncharacterized protein n=1 Tax=Smallanthus sonchifolius TaxID=185202 RepID=A0ACB9HEK4_9ASTR|nr:hypothetical protein L1987_36200 [Smallanthus sonchifolius]
MHVATFSTLNHTAAAQNVTTVTGDRQALLAIKSMITDPQGLMTTWNDSTTNFCQWQGVTCSPRRPRVTILELPSGGLTGNLSPAIGNLSFLKAIRLQNNSFTGEIPSEIGRLFRLEELLLFNNSFNGNIPTAITNCSNLQILHLGYNNLVGRIPSGFGSLSMLNILIVHGNILEGGIPTFIANLTLLEALSLGDCQLGGILPDVFHRLTNLRRIALPGNNLFGTIPPSFFNLSSLEQVFDILSLSTNSFGTGDADEMKFINDLSICHGLGVLDLGYNQLRGFFPESFRNLSPTLYFLSVASNHFSGGLSSSIGNLSGLTSLELSSNELTGTLPATIGNLANLRRLDVTNNSFSGNIPDLLGNLSWLVDLYLTSNQFNGTIPSSLGNCTRLIRLNLDRNNLSGDIPSQLFQLTSLSISLNLGYNQLSGTLPDEVGKLKSLTEIILANNRLSGELPSSLGSCSSLQSLNISNNFFSGSFPASLESLRALENLDVSRNNFTGEIPTYLEVIPLRSLNLSYNGFRGEVLSKGVFTNASSVSIVGNDRLCGGVPELQMPKCSSNEKKKKLSLAVILVISLVSALLLVAVVVFFVCCWRKKDVVDKSPETVSGVSLVQVSFETLHKATDGFSTKNFIGEGGFSSVYKGCLDPESVNFVAVKVLNLHRRGGTKSFIAECEALRNARHRNLTKVITCCSGVDFQGNEFKAIVYEFMPNGSLDQWLHNPQIGFPQLSVIQRVCIAMDVAYALDYLHLHAGKTIVHCDLKPSNILLDEDMVAHVGDFGISKILQTEYQNRHNSSSAGVRGTIGYAAPEYGVGSKVSRSGDMYSYGILLLEIVTCKKPTDVMFGDGLSLHNYAKRAMNDDGVLGIVDPVLLKDDEKIGLSANKEEITGGYMNHERCLRLLLEIGVSCSMESPQYRMDTASVIQELQLIKDAVLGNSTL